MEFNNFKDYNEDIFDDAVSLREVLEKYLKQWKWYLLSILLFMGGAYYIIISQSPKYQISSSILIKDLQSGNSVSGLSEFEDLGLVSSRDNSLENEIFILTSRRLMKKVVKDLNLNTIFLIEGSRFDKEIYPNYPLFVNYIDKESSVNDTLKRNDFLKFNHFPDNIYSYFKIKIISRNEFEIFDKEDISQGVKKFGVDFKTEIGTLNIILNPNFDFDRIINRTIIFRIIPLEFSAAALRNKITVEPVDDRSRVVKLSIREEIVNKGLAIINNLIDQYNADAIEDKNMIHLNTIDFLNERIKLLTSELGAIERSAEKFKVKKGMVSDHTDASIYMSSSSENERQLVGARTQLELIKYMIEKLKANTLNETLPVNIGLSDVSITALTNEYNTFVLQRKRILKSSSDKNPAIVSIDTQLESLKNSMLVSLMNLKNSILIQIKSLSVQGSKLDYRISSVPRNETELRNIVREHDTKNILYQFLLQKREESMLSKSVNIDKAKIIDSAFSNMQPVSPKKNIIYFAALFLSLILPTIIIYLKDMLDTKVHDERDVDKLNIPVLGDIPEAENKNLLFINEDDNSKIAEAFRYVRTNLSFILDRKEKGKIIFVTSTIQKEGKTHVSINIATSLAISGKKVLLLALDLRAPRITKYLAIKDVKKPGVTNFIKDKELKVSDLIISSPVFKNLDIINSGDIPPNPVELLMSKRLDEIFEYAKPVYDFIIVDTAPVGMVTDTIQVSHFADMTMFVIRADHLDKKMLGIVKKLNNENKLPKLYLLLNGVKQSTGTYGYSYSYGVQKKKSWLSKFFNRS